MQKNPNTKKHTEKAPERIWLQKHKDEPVINPTWTAEPCPLDRGDGQFEYIRADLVEETKQHPFQDQKIQGRCRDCKHWDYPSQFQTYRDPSYGRMGVCLKQSEIVVRHIEGSRFVKEPHRIVLEPEAGYCWKFL